MSKITELQNEVNALKGLLAQAGIFQPVRQESSHAPDYIAHGSTEHAAFLGLAEVEDVAQAERDGYTVYTSPRTGKAWRLEDEIGVMRFYPGVDPNKAIILVLRQKVNVIESGPPPAPKDAPTMFTGGEVMYG